MAQTVGTNLGTTWTPDAKPVRAQAGGNPPVQTTGAPLPSDTTSAGSQSLQDLGKHYGQTYESYRYGEKAHVAMTIDPAHLKTPEEAKAYQEYCALKKTVEGHTAGLKANDNKAGDSFPDKGQVGVNDVKMNGQNCTGGLTYDPQTGKPSDMWMNVDGQTPAPDGVYDSHRSYEFRDNGQTRVYKQEGCGAQLDGANHVIGMDKTKESFVVDNQTGMISCKIDRE